MSHTCFSVSGSDISLSSHSWALFVREINLNGYTYAYGLLHHYNTQSIQVMTLFTNYYTYWRKFVVINDISNAEKDIRRTQNVLGECKYNEIQAWVCISVLLFKQAPTSQKCVYVCVCIHRQIYVSTFSSRLHSYIRPSGQISHSILLSSVHLIARSHCFRSTIIASLHIHTPTSTILVIHTCQLILSYYIHKPYTHAGRQTGTRVYSYYM